MSDFIKLHDKDFDGREFAIRISDIRGMEDLGSECGTHIFYDEVREIYSNETISEILRLIERAEEIKLGKIKLGKWVGVEYDGYADGNPVYDVWECSECTNEWNGDKDSLPKYCPHCGAKMEVEE